MEARIETSYYLKVHGNRSLDRVIVSPRGNIAAFTHRATCSEYRPNNQDGLLVLGDFFAVADGLGGMAGGVQACQTTLNVGEDGLRADGLNEKLFRKINEAIFAEVRKNPALKGMGSTLAALEISPGRASVLSCGDSRVYLIRGSQVGLLTLDQNLAAMLFQAGKQPLKNFPAYDFQEYYEYIRNYKGREVLASSLGYPELEIFSSSTDLQAGDRFLLCTDGPGKYLAYPDFIQVITSGKSVEAVLQELYQRTLIGMGEKMAAEAEQGEVGDNFTGILCEPRP